MEQSSAKNSIIASRSCRLNASRDCFKTSTVTGWLLAIFSPLIFHSFGRVCTLPQSLIRASPYAIRTEQACVGSLRRFILLHDKRHPKEIGAAWIEKYLAYPAEQFQRQAVARRAGSRLQRLVATPRAIR
jgi:hypothetical protein